MYLIAGGTDFYPENVLFEKHTHDLKEFPKYKLDFEKHGHKYETFREYTDCLYAAYGTKWNGNAAATNGSLFIVQDERIRRLTPLECERLMGFPGNYTKIENGKNTNRYQAIGNSWVVPVISWIGENLLNIDVSHSIIDDTNIAFASRTKIKENCHLIFCNDDIIGDINCSKIPENPIFKSMKTIVEADADEKLYLSPVGCYGIIRRKNERHLHINKSLEAVLLANSSKMDFKDIEKQSKEQKRGKYSNENNTNISSYSNLDLMIVKD